MLLVSYFSLFKALNYQEKQNIRETGQFQPMLSQKLVPILV